MTLLVLQLNLECLAVQLPACVHAAGNHGRCSSTGDATAASKADSSPSPEECSAPQLQVSMGRWVLPPASAASCMSERVGL